MKFLTRSAFCTVALLCAAAAAHAGTRAIDSKEMIPSAPVAPVECKWNGFYLGANLGGAIGNADVDARAGYTDSGYLVHSDVAQIRNAGAQDIYTEGFTGGGQAGYNFQAGRFVLGAEADFNALTLDDSHEDSRVYRSAPPTSFTIRQSVSTDWLFTARARVGFTVGRCLIYATGGLALTEINYDGLFTDNYAAARATGSINDTKAGWTVGGGLEYQLTCRWSLKAEYLYADFGNVSTRTSNLVADRAYNNPFFYSSDLTTHIARVGVNYHF